MKKVLLVSSSLLIFLLAFKPNKQEDLKNYFSFPLNTAEKTSLSGCFGDIRTNHFHAGLDIRTNGKTGMSVYASAEGYVSRIRTMLGGYGNAVYITHPNGLTTVYGHLEAFSEPIKQFLRANQYARQQWDIDLNLVPNQIQVYQGELIGLSGNTGGSGGPHLHFEIRDAQENALNPASFNFWEVMDSRAPIIHFISLTTLSEDARINGQFGSFDFEPFPNNETNRLEINEPISAKGKIGLEILTYDRVDNSPFKMGVQRINLKQDNAPVYDFNLKKLNFSTNIDMNAHINYQRFVENNEKIHRCYVISGDRQLHYTSSDNGYLNFNQNKNLSLVQLSISDTYGNSKNLEIPIRIEQNDNSEEYLGNNLSEIVSNVTLHDHWLIIRIFNAAPESRQLRILNLNNKEFNLYEAYHNQNSKTFLYDLEKGLPKEITFENSPIPIPVNAKVSLEAPIINAKSFSADFSNTLYTTIYANFVARANELHLDKDFSPLKGKFRVTWTPIISITSPEKQKVYLKRKKPKYIGGEWLGNQITFYPKELGDYVILGDYEGPEIRELEVNPDKLRFKLNDDLSGIKDFRCTINGEWVLMDYEYKNGTIWSEKLDPSQQFYGHLQLIVTDNCNNTSIFEADIN